MNPRSLLLTLPLFDGLGCAARALTFQQAIDDSPRAHGRLDADRQYVRALTESPIAAVELQTALGVLR